jgi:hypothetical protein
MTGTMKLLDFKIPIPNLLQRAWWVKVDTESPACTYYFGPFDSEKEAQFSQVGYVDDLIEEGAKNISVEVQRTRPKYLTIYDDA